MRFNVLENTPHEAIVESYVYILIQGQDVKPHANSASGLVTAISPGNL